MNRCTRRAVDCSLSGGAADVSIALRPIDRDNWHECIRLTPTPGQEALLPSNLFYVAEARFYPEWTLLGVYAGSRMVGFAMYGLDPDDGTVNFLHLMIDGKEQGKGYGKAAIRLYKSYVFEFEEIGLETDDEVFMRLRAP